MCTEKDVNTMGKIIAVALIVKLAFINSVRSHDPNNLYDFLCEEDNDCIKHYPELKCTDDF